MRKIEWNRVTWYSKLAAVIIYVGTFAIAFYLGRLYEAANYYQAWQPQQIPGGGSGDQQFINYDRP